MLIRAWKAALRLLLNLEACSILMETHKIGHIG